MARKTRLIIDAMNLVHRAYHTAAERLRAGDSNDAKFDDDNEKEYAPVLDAPIIKLPDAFRADGDAAGLAEYPTGVLYVCFASIMQWVDRFVPDQVVLVWDGKRDKCWRRALYEDYKCSRSKRDASHTEQETMRRRILYGVELADVVTATRLTGCANIMAPDELEADDVISLLTRRFTASEYVTDIIVSTDSDLIQLVRAHQCSVYNPMKKSMYSQRKPGEAIFETRELDQTYEEYAGSALQVLLKKALVGDTSDDVPGVAGCGDKTASELVPFMEDLLKDKLAKPSALATPLDVAKIKSKVSGRALTILYDLFSATDRQKNFLLSYQLCDLHRETYVHQEGNMRDAIKKAGRQYVQAMKRAVQNDYRPPFANDAEFGPFVQFFGQRGFRAAFDAEKRAEITNTIAALHKRERLFVRAIGSHAVKNWKGLLT